MTAWSRAVAAILMWIWSAASVMAADELNGTYLGIDDARGASIRIAPDAGGFRGTFYDSSGNSQRFSADRTDDTAEAVLGMDGRTILLRMVPLPFGAEVPIIPFDNQGRLLLESSRLLSFVREGVKLPDRPAEYIAAPRSPGETIAANAFLSSPDSSSASAAAVRSGVPFMPGPSEVVIRPRQGSTDWPGVPV